MSKPFSNVDWDYYASCYDSLRQLRPYGDMLRYVSQKVAECQSGSILDASCGTGNFPLALSEHRPESEWTLTGIDMSEAMLKLAREKCASLAHCSFSQVDLNQKLPLATGQFDQVVSLNTLYAVESPARTLSEFYRVLKPDGYLFLVTPRIDYENGQILREHCQSDKPESYWTGGHDSPAREAKLVHEAIQDEKLASDMLEIARINRLIAHHANYHFLPTKDLTSLVEACGFSVISVESVYARQDDFIIAKKRS